MLLSHRRAGFTLIELLIVVVIVGVLAAIAIPKFGTTRDKAYVSSMKSDLRNMVTAEEAYFSDYSTYTTTADLIAAGRAAPSAGVTFTDGAVDGQGWSATANDSYLPTTKTCTIWVGPGHQVATTSEGAPACN
ncbi:MAG: hypothetical protein NVS9B3_12580 [Gemmatimonadaceae bacterium]